MSARRWKQLEYAARPDGCPAPMPGRWVTLLRAGLVRRGPTPPRNAGGRLSSYVRMYATAAGLAALKERAA
jgi:hypothetical protein